MTLTRKQLENAAAAKLELNRRAEAKKGIQDLYYFNRDVLGYTAMAEQPHRLMCDSASDKTKRRKLHLWPRGHFKSTMITVGYSVQSVCEDPNTRILIGNLNLQNAKSFLREIKGHFERNEKLKHLYGDHVSDARNDSGKWSETQIISKQRTKNLKEPTIQVAGVGQALASQHYDKIILDDLIDQSTVATAEQIEKTLQWYRLAISLLEPDGELIIIGTRYHFGDLYGHIIKTLANEFDIQVHTVFAKDGNGYLFPSRFDDKAMELIRKEQGSYVFACQYLNNPVDDETAKFKKSQIQYFDPSILTDQRVYTTMTVDRAYSLAKTADFTGITIRSMTADRKWYVRYAKRLKASEGEIINEIFRLYKQYNVSICGIEQKAFKYTFKPVLDEQMREREQFIRITELIGSASKVARIEGLVPLFESNSIYLLEGEMSDLEDELLRFPRAEHDDLVDSLAYHLDPQMTPPNLKETVFQEAPEGSFQWVLQQHIAKQQEEYD